MKSSRSWTRPLIAIWPLIVVFVAIATVGHDVAMAGRTHLGPGSIHSDTASTRALANVTYDERHDTDLAEPQPSSDSDCPKDSCSKWLDCGAVRVSVPVPAPDPDLEFAAPFNTATSLVAWIEPSAPVTSIASLYPPGIRRALLQLFLN